CRLQVAERQVRERMMGQSWQIGRVLGIPLRVHVSWFIVFALLSWSLSQGYFPAVLRHVPMWQYWVLGIVAALLLFVSVLVHELGSCVFSLRFRLRILLILTFLLYVIH